MIKSIISLLMVCINLVTGYGCKGGRCKPRYNRCYDKDDCHPGITIIDVDIDYNCESKCEPCEDQKCSGFDDIFDLIEVYTHNTEECLCNSALSYLQEIRIESCLLINNFALSGFPDHTVEWAFLESQLEPLIGATEAAKIVNQLSSTEKRVTERALEAFRNCLCAAYVEITGCQEINNANVNANVLSSNLLAKLNLAFNAASGELVETIADLTEILTDIAQCSLDGEALSLAVNTITEVVSDDIEFITGELATLKTELDAVALVALNNLLDAYEECLVELLKNLTLAYNSAAVKIGIVGCGTATTITFPTSTSTVFSTTTLTETDTETII
ncbi:hypothetical protein A0H76_3023, partial [Hepatospora eriocheir]